MQLTGKTAAKQPLLLFFANKIFYTVIGHIFNMPTLVKALNPLEDFAHYYGFTAPKDRGACLVYKGMLN